MTVVSPDRFHCTSETLGSGDAQVIIEDVRPRLEF